MCVHKNYNAAMLRKQWYEFNVSLILIERLNLSG